MVLELAAIIELASKCSPTVAPETMAAIIRVESGFNPYAIGINAGTPLDRQPSSADEAVAQAVVLLKAGANIDLGLGQINSSNLEWLGLTVADAFDACRNVAAAARVIESGFRSARPKAAGDKDALHMALSAYNTGSHERGFRNGYVRKVLNAGTYVVPAIEDIRRGLTPAEGVEPPSGGPNAKPLATEPDALDVFRSSPAKRVNLFN
ncbi:lytic transglycosylase domain-containing protein [Aureimonas sp. N4]|uniref:lytic transglycosylase domain-containing protein n=1 Tax=Aureimonas sp. N4 TaxID=1638165 RepID=UPI00078261F3|nr:lytic transglycosylase domain-containing protein [Aureimonas sp. N4]